MDKNNFDFLVNLRKYTFSRLYNYEGSKYVFSNPNSYKIGDVKGKFIWRWLFIYIVTLKYKSTSSVGNKQ
jgi:hypothetical protein